MKAVTFEEARPMTFRTQDFTNIVRPYFGSVGELCEGPQTFLVDMPDEGATVKPHFHDVDQYQVIVRGDGRLGSEPASPIVFHYADAYTPYGPIIAGKDGIAFYTIRAGCAGGYFGMPEARHLIKGKPGRNIVGRFMINQPSPSNGNTVDELLMQADEGVLVIGRRMGPHAESPGIPLTGGAQYYLVGTGSLWDGDRCLPPLSMILVQPGEPAPTLNAGPEGAEILIMQLPAGGERRGSRLGTLEERGLNNYQKPPGMEIKH